jgi:hypothetical protein
MTPVNTSRLTPRYGASNRTARISRMRTAAAVANTRNRDRDGDTVEEYGRPHLLATERLSPLKPLIIGRAARQ